jgi:hydrogenase maturation protease
MPTRDFGILTKGARKLTTMPKPIRVLGMGNVLMADDGLGPFVARVLEAEYEFPEHVELVDVGTPGADFSPFLDHAGAVIVIDTVHSDGPPGTLRRYDMRELLSSPPPARIHPHQPGLREALMAAELTDSAPEELIVIGVVPESIEAVARLGATVRATVPAVVAAILAELERLGAKGSRRADPLRPDIWWE